MNGNGRGDDRAPVPELEIPEQMPWSRRAQAIAAVVWPSFLAAAFATMLFFAFVDPAAMPEAFSLPVEFSRMTGYAIGFFFFWLITAISSGISVFLLRTARRDSKNRLTKD